MCSTGCDRPIKLIVSQEKRGIAEMKLQQATECVVCGRVVSSDHQLSVGNSSCSRCLHVTSPPDTELHKNIRHFTRNG